MMDSEALRWLEMRLCTRWLHVIQERAFVGK